MEVPDMSAGARISAETPGTKPRVGGSVADTWHGTFKEFGKPKRKDGIRGLTTFNARSEGAASSATFREAMGSQRCLVPADGWYEWTGEKYPKTKWLFEREDADWFCFAGL
jgi:putative SOS response-associated peptidase YedK